MGEISDGQPLFPGESEVDQLYIVQKIIGSLTPDHLELFMANTRFAGTDAYVIYGVQKFSLFFTPFPLLFPSFFHP